MLIFRKAAAGELKEDSGLGILAKQCEINVEEVGVGGAKDFFEAKVIFVSFFSRFLKIFITWFTKLVILFDHKILRALCDNTAQWL